MAYIDGFVMAVPIRNKDAFIEHAKKFDAVFLEKGATRILECWGDDVPERKAVQAKDDEAVLFSWVEWPDKKIRDEAMKQVMADPRMKPENNPMPFDGKRMIFGGFSPVVTLGA